MTSHNKPRSEVLGGGNLEGIGSSLRPGRLEISTRMVILIRSHTKKYTKGDSIKKFFAGYVGWLIRTICTKFGDNWTNGTGNID